MDRKTAEAAHMIRRGNVLQDIVCFLSGGDILGAGCVSEYRPCS
jgi:hypothetical protein